MTLFIIEKYINYDSEKYSSEITQSLIKFLIQRLNS